MKVVQDFQDMHHICACARLNNSSAPFIKGVAKWLLAKVRQRNKRAFSNSKVANEHESTCKCIGGNQMTCISADEYFLLARMRQAFIFLSLVVSLILFTMTASWQYLGGHLTNTETNYSISYPVLLHLTHIVPVVTTTNIALLLVIVILFRDQLLKRQCVEKVELDSAKFLIKGGFHKLMPYDDLSLRYYLKNSETNQNQTVDMLSFFIRNLALFILKLQRETKSAQLCNMHARVKYSIITQLKSDLKIINF
ncbi:hypothetical protein EGR_10876 [Echinococcus granulosus]|uniref:Uncharacterized protein n=1 Tax=Echinococcus granulosus TaxID=6210 RepID=W6TZK9_ECHGR|nr:hypothetical protein EGR_10876 [Echinococcus granulosus]EUB54265.1 hypothetical protein EGR_10876 [Echinococcus granulosus]